MYAVIATGGKQYRVSTGTVIDVERLGEVGDAVEIPAVMIVDGDTVIASRSDLAEVSVGAEIVAEGRGVKIDGFNYKNKSNQYRRWGHRQAYSTIEIKTITGA